MEGNPPLRPTHSLTDCPSPPRVATGNPVDGAGAASQAPAGMLGWEAKENPYYDHPFT